MPSPFTSLLGLNDEPTEEERRREKLFEVQTIMDDPDFGKIPGQRQEDDPGFLGRLRDSATSGFAGMLGAFAGLRRLDAELKQKTIEALPFGFSETNRGRELIEQHGRAAEDAAADVDILSIAANDLSPLKSGVIGTFKEREGFGGKASAVLETAAQATPELLLHGGATALTLPAGGVGGLVTGGASMAGRSFGSARAEGTEFAPAFAGAAVEGSLGAILERIGVGKVFNLGSGAVTRHLTKALRSSAFAEGGTEAAQELVSFMVEASQGRETGDLGARLLDAAAAGAAAGGTLGSVANIVAGTREIDTIDQERPDGPGTGTDVASEVANQRKALPPATPQFLLPKVTEGGIDPETVGTGPNAFTRGHQRSEGPTAFNPAGLLGPGSPSDLEFFQQQDKLGPENESGLPAFTLFDSSNDLAVKEAVTTLKETSARTKALLQKKHQDAMNPDLYKPLVAKVLSGEMRPQDMSQLGDLLTKISQEGGGKLVQRLADAAYNLSVPNIKGPNGKTEPDVPNNRRITEEDCK